MSGIYKVMVLMSTYNGEKYLREQIDSILGQTGVSVKLLIRDDGSKDNTVEIVKQYCKENDDIKLVEGKNVGFAESFMELVYRANLYSDISYFAFSDQDDVWLNDKLISAIHMLEGIHEKNAPNLYFSTARAVDKDLKFLFDYGKYKEFKVYI